MEFFDPAPGFLAQYVCSQMGAVKAHKDVQRQKQAVDAVSEAEYKRHCAHGKVASGWVDPGSTGAWASNA